MGRKLMRVPMDFDWPLGKIWKGYENPHYQTDCPEEGKNCFNGYTAASKWLEAVCRLIHLLGDEAAFAPHAADKPDRTFPHPYLKEWPQAPTIGLPGAVSRELRGIDDRDERSRAFGRAFRTYRNRLVPLTDELKDFVEKLSGKKYDGGALSGGGEWQIREKLMALAGVDNETWGVCPVCKGHGIHPDSIELAEAWERDEPPEGEGYQLWETTSEGSPVSPVFDTLDALCEWCAKNATTFGSFKASKEEWEKMLGEDFVCHREGNRVWC